MAQVVLSVISRVLGRVFGLAPRLRWLACVLLAVAVTACSSNGIGPRLLDPQDVDLSAKRPGTLRSHHSSAAPDSGKSGYQLFEGSGLAASSEENAEPPPGVTASDGQYTINIDKADINEAAKLILNETLGLNYIVDPRVQGTVTLVTNRPLTAEKVLEAVEAALRLNGAALVQSDGAAKIVALQEVLEGELGQADAPGTTTPGYGLSVVPLRHIGTNNML